MKTYLVTGGAGFIGSNFIHYMFRKYNDTIRIINVDALTYAGNLENLKGVEERDDYTFIRADICDRDAVNEIFQENDIDRVVHFAAESHVDRSIKSPEVFIKTNVLGTAVMLNCARAAWENEDGSYKEGKKFLHVSTDEVYGSLDEDGGYFYETTPYAPHSPYSGRKLPVYGDGKNVRDWLYVDDHAKGIDMVIEKGRLGETYNIGGHNEKQNIEIIHIILDTLLEMLPEGDERRKHISRDLITYVEDRKGHDRRYAIAPDKIKSEIGWEPETMFKDGIKKTIAWFFEHEDWMANVTSGDYQKYYDDMYQNK